MATNSALVSKRVIAILAIINQSAQTMKKQQRPTAFSDQIRQAVTDSGMSQYAISKKTGISKSTLCRFMNGDRGLPMNTLDTLASYLRLEVRMLGPLKKE